MSEFKVTFVRHGEAKSNTDGEQGTVGSDKPLTAEGISQAKETAAFIAARIAVELVLSSPKERTRQTAREIALATAIGNIIIDKRLDEIRKGDWEGRPVGEVVQLEGEVPEEEKPFFRPPQGKSIPGENWPDVGKRASEVVLELLAKDENNSVVVSHNHPIEAAIGVLERKPIPRWEDIDIANAAITQYIYLDGMWRPNAELFNIKPYES